MGIGYHAPRFPGAKVIKARGFFHGDVERINLENKKVYASQGQVKVPHEHSKNSVHFLTLHAPTDSMTEVVMIGETDIKAISPIGKHGVAGKFRCFLCNL